MTNDIFGGLGDLFGGFAKSVLPKDSPEGQLMAAASDVADLQKQEADLLVEIGREAYEQNPSAWAQDTKLTLIQQNLEAAKAALDTVKQTQEQAQAAQAEEDAKGRCSKCGNKNPESVKFCQGCGTPLGEPPKSTCTTCGADLGPGIRFCGECGARQD
ncbi:MAG: zinc ribbon domain-containing protein [Propionibacteriaceae bacterium]|nr:zinc ribbon domain-containing protein [Propionibacteriaceae bacterium]